MFALAVIEDHIRVPPHELNKPYLDAIRNQIACAFLNKVLRNVGLCISLHDMLAVDGGFLYPSDGGPHYRVLFRLAVFSPFVGEVLEGRLTSCDESGLQVSLGFFSDIHIPAVNLQEPSVFDEEEKLWVWKFNDNDMFMDIDEVVRFRVQSVRYPPLPLVQEKGDAAFAPMQVIHVSVAHCVSGTMLSALDLLWQSGKCQYQLRILVDTRKSLQDLASKKVYVYAYESFERNMKALPLQQTSALPSVLLTNFGGEVCAVLPFLLTLYHYRAQSRQNLKDGRLANHILEYCENESSRASFCN